jgi:hypothetical protein
VVIASLGLLSFTKSVPDTKIIEVKAAFTIKRFGSDENEYWSVKIIALNINVSRIR